MYMTLRRWVTFKVIYLHASPLKCDFSLQYCAAFGNISTDTMAITTAAAGCRPTWWRMSKPHVLLHFIVISLHRPLTAIVSIPWHTCTISDPASTAATGSCYNIASWWNSKHKRQIQAEYVNWRFSTNISRYTVVNIVTVNVRGSGSCGLFNFLLLQLYLLEQVNLQSSNFVHK